MEQPLTNFFRALRASDVRISIPEGLDAFRAVELLGYQNRGDLKEALSQVLAKTPDEKERFAQVFELFFHVDETSFADDPLQQENEEETEEASPSGEEGTEEEQPEMGNLSQMLLEGDEAGLEMALEKAERAVKLDQIRFFTQRGLYVRRMMEALGLERLDQDIQAMGGAPGGGGGGDGEAATLTEGRTRLFEEVGNRVEKQIALYTANEGRRFREEALRTMRISNLDKRDHALMSKLVEKMVKRLVSMHKRKKRRKDRGVLDVRRTLRKNMPHDGVLIEPVWKLIKTERPSVFAICDVSGSVSLVAQFLLMFLNSLNEVLPRVRSFAFSSHLVEVTDIFKANNFEDAATQVLTEVGFRSTDYGQSLEDFQKLALNKVSRRSTVIILGDGRSNYLNPRLDILKEIYNQCRRVIWLNPEPKSFWNMGDSEMPKYLSACHQAQVCNSLAHLERVVDDILRNAQ